MKKKKRFTHTITRALGRIEQERALMLLDSERKNTRGIEFDLKNNFGWKEKTEIEHSGNINTKVIVLPAKKKEGADVNPKSETVGK